MNAVVFIISALRSTANRLYDISSSCIYSLCSKFTWLVELTKFLSSSNFTNTTGQAVRRFL